MTAKSSDPAVRTILVLGLIGVALAYLGALRGPYLHDDHANLGPLLVPTSSIVEWLDLVLSNASGVLRRPISNASFLLNFAAFGDSAFAFKAVNLALHLLTGFLVFRLMLATLERISRPDAPKLAAVAAIAWCAHPLLLSSVAYVVQRMTILSALFSILAITSFVRALPPAYTQDSPPSRWRPIAGFYIWSLLAVLSKENGALTPVLAWAIWLALPAAARSSRPARTAGALCIAGPILAGLIVATLIGPSMINYAGRDFTLVERLCTQAVLLWEYLGLLLLPNPSWMGLFWDAHPIYNPRSLQFAIAATAWIAAGIAAWKLRHRYPLPLLGLTWFLAGHLMESSFLPLEIAYEHRNYLPSIFPTLALVAAATSAAQKARIPPRTAHLAIISALLLLTAVRSIQWSSTGKFAEHELRRSPLSLRANNAMLSWAVDRNDLPSALHFERRTEQLSNNAAWAMSGRMLLRCFGAEVPVDFPALQRRSVEEVGDARLLRLHQGLSKLMLTGECQALDRASYVQLLNALARAADDRQLPLQASEYHYQLASLAWFANDPTTARAQLVAASTSDPAAQTPLERLVFLDIQSRSYSAALENLAKLNILIESTSPWKSHRVSYWCGELQRSAIASSTQLNGEQMSRAGCKIAQNAASERND